MLWYSIFRGFQTPFNILLLLGISCGFFILYFFSLPTTYICWKETCFWQLKPNPASWISLLLQFLSLVLGVLCFYGLLQVWRRTVVQLDCIAANRYLLHEQTLPISNWGSTEIICLLQDAADSKYPKGKAMQVCKSKVRKTKGKILLLVSPKTSC